MLEYKITEEEVTFCVRPCPSNTVALRTLEKFNHSYIKIRGESTAF